MHIRDRMLSLFLLALILSACAPAAQVDPTRLPPTYTPLLPTPASTSTQLPAASPTAYPTETPSPEKIVEAGRLDKAEAVRFLEEWYRLYAGALSEILSIEETTPEEIWQQLRVQVFRFKDPGGVYEHSFLIHDQEVWQLNTGFKGQGVEPEDLVPADLDGDGKLELVYAYALDHEVEQAMHIGVFRIKNGAGTLLELDWVYPGELEIHKDAVGQVQLLGGSQGEPLGYLGLQGQVLSLAEEPDLVEELDTYTSRRFGVSFQIPTTWKEAGEDHYKGEDGFFELSTYPSLASGSPYDDLHFSLVRACNWEVNAAPGRYGEQPGVQIWYVDSPTAHCQIQPGKDAPGMDAPILFKPPSGGFAMLRTDMQHVKLIHETLEFHFPGGVLPQQPKRAFDRQGDLPDLDIETNQFGELTLEAYRLFPEDVHTPSHPEDMEKSLASILDRHREWRKTWDNDHSLETSLVLSGGQQATVEVDRGSGSTRVLIKLGGETIYSFTSSLKEPMSMNLSSWGDQWVLEIDGTLVVDGQCCAGAYLNPQGSEHMVWFYARQNGMWYYLELGKYN